MGLQRKVKTALDEVRLLILGVQIFLGFQFNLMFRQDLTQLPAQYRVLDVIALACMIFACGLLMTPPLQHRLVEGGRATARILRITTWFAAGSLVVFALGLAVDMFMLLGHLYRAIVGIAAACASFGLAMFGWFAIGWRLRRRLGNAPMDSDEQDDPSLETKVEQLLTEARVIIPGGQALLGFQMIAIYTQAFAKLDSPIKTLHVAALLMTGLAVIMLMAPAAIHRIGFSGQDSLEFHRIGSILVTGASFPLASGLALDTFVAVKVAGGQTSEALPVAVAMFLTLSLLWYAFPVIARLAVSRRAPRTIHDKQV